MSFVSKFVGLNKVGEASKRLVLASVILAVGAIVAVILIKVL